MQEKGAVEFPILAAIVPWSVAEIQRSSKAWAQQGGKELDLSAADAKTFVSESIAAATPLLTKNPQQKDDYETFEAVAKKMRR